MTLALQVGVGGGIAVAVLFCLVAALIEAWREYDNDSL
jgi:hypothetical protein